MHICIVAIVTTSLVLQDLQPGGSLRSLSLSLIGSAAIQVVVVLSALLVVRKTLAEHSNQVDTPANISRRLDVRLKLHRGIWLAGTLLTLTCFQWTQVCTVLCTNRFAGRGLVLLPALVPVLLSWLLFYSVERELDGSVRKMSRLAFVFDQSRMLLLLPVCAILFVVAGQDVVEALPATIQNTMVAKFLRIVPLLAVVFAFPILLRRTWKTEALGKGALRTRLERHCMDLGFVKRDILVWKTDQRQRNAAIAGILPSWRYILLSDRLIQDLPTQQIESVFLHEIGHAKNRHHLRLTIVAIFLVCASTSTLSTVDFHFPSTNVGALTRVCIGTIGLILSLCLIGRFARLFELQADLWAARQSPDSPFAYLTAIASLSGGNPDQRSWMHPSFQQRCDFLLAAKEAPQRLKAQLWLTLLATAVLGVILVFSSTLG